VPEDRFGDLGGGTRAGDKLADLDRREPEEQPKPARPRGRYTWVVGVAAVIAIIVAGINSLPHGSRGSHGPPVGRPLPKFAAPSATGPLAGDPNVKQSRGDKGTTNKVPACDVRLPGALTVCQFESKPLVITFIVPGAGQCESYLDRVQRVQREFRGVNFLAVVSGRSKGDVASLVRRHGWTFPVAVDDNLAVFDTYRISFCATSVFAYRGGRVRSTKVLAQDWPDATLRAVIRATAAGR
jgi:hypothetical protein